jgi:fucose permease
MLPILCERWSLSYTQAGYLFTAQFLGATLGVSFSGGVIRRWGYRTAMIIGLATIALGVGVLPVLSLRAGLFAIACYGVAIGLMGPTCNLLVAEVNAGQRGAALNLLNFSWSVGAVSCPFLVAAAARVQHTSFLLYTISAIALLVSMAILAIVPSGIDEREGIVGAEAGSRRILWSRPGVLVLCVLFFLYVGTENSIGGWLASFAKRGGSAGNLPIVTSSFFYLALLAGRMVAPVILWRTPEVTLARIGLVASVGGTVGLVSAHTLTGIIAGASVAGLGLSVVFPITIAMMSRSFGTDSPRAGTVLFNMANLGGATLPFLVGYISQRSGSLSVGLVVALAATATMLALFCFHVQSERPLKQTETDCFV